MCSSGKVPALVVRLEPGAAAVRNRVCVYALMDDRYPSTDEHQSVRLEFPYPDAERELATTGCRWSRWVLAIPHYIVLFFLHIAAFFVVIIAWFAVPVHGRYPRGMFEFVEGRDPGGAEPRRRLRPDPRHRRLPLRSDRRRRARRRRRPKGARSPAFHRPRHRGAQASKARRARASCVPTGFPATPHRISPRGVTRCRWGVGPGPALGQGPPLSRRTPPGRGGASSGIR